MKKKSYDHYCFQCCFSFLPSSRFYFDALFSVSFFISFPWFPLINIQFYFTYFILLIFVLFLLSISSQNEDWSNFYEANRDYSWCDQQWAIRSRRHLWNLFTDWWPQVTKRLFVKQMLTCCSICKDIFFFGVHYTWTNLNLYFM